MGMSEKDRDRGKKLINKERGEGKIEIERTVTYKYRYLSAKAIWFYKSEYFRH